MVGQPSFELSLVPFVVCCLSLVVTNIVSLQEALTGLATREPAAGNSNLSGCERYQERLCQGESHVD